MVEVSGNADQRVEGIHEGCGNGEGAFLLG